MLSFPPLQVQAGPVHARVTRPGGRPATAPLDARLASPRHGERVFYRRAPDGTSGVPINPLILFITQNWVRAEEEREHLKDYSL